MVSDGNYTRGDEALARTVHITGLGEDPSTETWRDAIAQSAWAELSKVQRDLAASQQDLTRMEAQRDEARSEARQWRATAERYLASLEAVAQDLWNANRENRRLTAENASALRLLNEAKEQP